MLYKSLETGAGLCGNMHSSQWRKIALFLYVCAIASLGKDGYAQSPPAPHVKVELIADDSSAAGRPMWAGLLFRLDEGWHIYWQNAGDSGEPPKIQWNLPAGFQAGAIRWPAPIRFGSQSVVDYGYEGEVLLMAPIEHPQSFQTGAKTEIAADLKYLVCREICVPGKAHLTLSLPAPSNQTSQWRALFQRTRAQIPRKAPASWKASADSDKDHFTLSVRTGFRVENAKFFPIEPAQIQNSTPQVFTATEKGFRLTLQKSDQLLKPIHILRGLLILGPGRAFEIAAPVVSR